MIWNSIVQTARYRYLWWEPDSCNLSDCLTADRKIKVARVCLSRKLEVNWGLPEAMMAKLTAKEKRWRTPRCVTSQNLYSFVFSWKIIYWLRAGKHSGNKLQHAFVAPMQTDLPWRHTGEASEWLKLAKIASWRCSLSIVDLTYITCIVSVVIMI